MDIIIASVKSKTRKGFGIKRSFYSSIFVFPTKSVGVIFGCFLNSNHFQNWMVKYFYILTVQSFVHCFVELNCFICNSIAVFFEVACSYVVVKYNHFKISRIMYVLVIFFMTLPVMGGSGKVIKQFGLWEWRIVRYILLLLRLDLVQVS